MLRAVPTGVDVVHVVLVADLDRCWQRAQGDPTRGLSKDRDFLARMHDRFRAGLPDLHADLVLDVEATPLDERVSRVVAEVARRLDGPPR